MPQQPSRIPVYEVAPATDAEFARLREALLARLCAPKQPAVEAAPEPAASPPVEDVPAPKLWELPAQEFGAIATAALWPQAEAAHSWVPQPPMTLDQYLKDGV